MLRGQTAEERELGYFAERNSKLQTEGAEFYIHDSVHRDSVLISSNKMQQYVGIYLLQVYSTCFGRPSRPSSGVQKTVTAASGTGHNNGATTFLQRGL